MGSGRRRHHQKVGKNEEKMERRERKQGEVRIRVMLLPSVTRAVMGCSNGLRLAWTLQGPTGAFADL